MHDSCVLNWSEARLRLMRLAPQLTKIIDNLSPSKQYKLYDVPLQYGALLSEGLGEYVCVPKDIRQQVTGMPFIVGNGVLETFVEINQRVISTALLVPGHIAGLSEIFNRRNGQGSLKIQQQISAGARSVFMLPRLSDQLKYHRLYTALKINHKKIPKTYFEQWQVFKELNQAHEKAAHNSTWWQANVLFFDKKWFSHFKDLEWLPLYNELLSVAWQQSYLARAQFICEQTFNELQALAKIRANEEILSFVKQLFLQAAGLKPALVPAINNDYAPVAQLQDVYQNFYELNQAHYDHIMMLPKFLNNYDKTQTGYTSLAWPGFLSSGGEPARKPARNFSINQIAEICQTYLTLINNNEMELTHSPLSVLKDRVSFSFFHDTYCGEVIKLSEQLEKNFSEASTGVGIFPRHSLFFKGCVQITRASPSK